MRPLTSIADLDGRYEAMSSPGVLVPIASGNAITRLISGQFRMLVTSFVRSLDSNDFGNNPASSLRR
jgi:hypothetical protein